MGDPSATPRARRLPSAAGALLIICIALSYFVQSTLRPVGGLYGKSPEYLALQARGFLAGRASLPIDPSPELLALPNPYDYKTNFPYRLHDASLYRGKYYLYFGPAPTLLLFVPYRLLTGRDLANRFAVSFLCIAGLLCACALLYLVVQHNRWEFPRWLELSAILLLGTSSFLGFLTTRPYFYEVAVAGGYLFVTAGFLCLFLALRRPDPDLAWLATSGLLFGFAIASRADLAIAAAVAGAFFALRFWGQWRLKVTFAAGMLLCVSGLAWFNYVRFGNPLETGHQYQLTDAAGNGLHLSLAHVLPTLRTYFLTLPAIASGMPFLRPNQVPLDPLFPTFMEPFAGILPMAPLLLAGVFVPAFFRPRDAVGNVVIRSMHAAAILLLLFLAFCGYSTGRYLAVFAPLLAFCTCISLLAFWQSLDARKQPIAQALIVALCVCSAAAISAMHAN